MELIERERKESVIFLRLNRPDVRNALSLALIEDLTVAVGEASADPEIRVIVLSGNGRHFCAGADLAWMRASAQLDTDGNRREAEKLARLFAVIDASPKAVIGDIHGAAIGGGAGLAAVCDYVLAADDAFFAFTEVRLGLIPAVISPFVLAKLGPSAARAYFTSGTRFDAARARELGLVHEVVPLSEREAALARIVAAYLTAAPGAVTAIKSLLHTLVAEPPHSMNEVRNLTVEAIAARRISVEAQQGLSAFLEQGKAPWLQ